MQQFFEMLQKLFSDIIGVVAGRGDDNSVAVKVLSLISGMFGGSAKTETDATQPAE